jgi:hypothetical protein
METRQIDREVGQGDDGPNAKLDYCTLSPN